jgi:hypothetical protein
MARRMTVAEEMQAIEDATAVRDAATDPTPASLDVAPSSVVLSVRVSDAQARALRQIAAERGESLSALLTNAVDRLLAPDGPDLFFGGLKWMAIYSGLQPGNAKTAPTPFEVVVSSPLPQSMTA